MMAKKPRSPWRIPLVRDMALVLLLKFALLFLIKIIWFDAPTAPVDGTQRMDQQFFGSASALPAHPLSSSVPEP
jgi:hypothetical protein